MRSLCTAIIHLREPAIRRVRGIVEPRLWLERGVDSVQYDPAESLLTIVFDRDQTGMAELVRVIEDLDTTVAGVAQRQAGIAVAAS